MNIFDIEQSKRDADFIKKNGDLELEVAADILEISQNIPYVGSLIKFGKVAINTKDWHFTRKLAKFLKEADDIADDKKEAFFSSLTQKDYKHISEYLIHVLDNAEETDKAIVLGRIYRARLMNEIDNETMLRLCSVVNRSFLPDLKKLPNYLEASEDNTIETQAFINLGLIDNFIGGTWRSKPICCLNETGELLYKILKDAAWFES